MHTKNVKVIGNICPILIYDRLYVCFVPIRIRKFDININQSYGAGARQQTTASRDIYY